MAYQDWIKVRDRVAFGQGPYAPSPSYTDITLPDGETDNAVRPGGTFATGRQSRNGQFEATSVTLSVGNRDGRYTPFYNASPYFPLTESCPYRRDVEYPVGTGTYYPIWAGVLSDVSAGFEGAAQGTAQLSFQQRVGLPSKKPLRALGVGQVINTKPTHFWPLDDEAGSEEAADALGGVPLSPLFWGTAGYGQYDFGVGNAPGDLGGTRLALTQDESSPYSGYTFSAALDPTLSETAHQAILIVNADTAATSLSRGGYVYAIRSDINDFEVVLYLKPTGAYYFKWHPSTSSGAYYALPPSVQTGTLFDGQDHAVGLTLSLSGTTVSVETFADGVSCGTGSFSIPTTSLKLSRVSVGGSSTSDYLSYLLSGSVANVATWDNIDADRDDLYAQMAVDWAGDTADVRLGRLADVAGLRDVTSNVVGGLASSAWVDTVGSFSRLIGPQAVAGRAFLDVLRELETAEIGRVYTSHDGVTVLASSSAFYTPIRSFTLSALTHFDLDDDFSADNDNAVNDWTGVRDGGVRQTYRASEAVIEAQGQQPVDAGTVPCATDDDVFQIGAWKVNTTAVPSLRLRIKVHASKIVATSDGDDLYAGDDVYAFADLYAGDSMLSEFFGVTEGDQVTLTDLPVGCPVSTFVGMVERVEKVFTGDDLKFLITLSQWIDIHEFDDVNYGRFAEDEGTITLTSNITAAATSMSATTQAGHPALTNAAGDLPFDISVNGERVTVTAVSGASSPQTLTVTRGVAPTTAVAHTAGDVISIWNPGVFGV